MCLVFSLWFIIHEKLLQLVVYGYEAALGICFISCTIFLGMDSIMLKNKSLFSVFKTFFCQDGLLKHPYSMFICSIDILSRIKIHVPYYCRLFHLRFGNLLAIEKKIRLHTVTKNSHYVVCFSYRRFKFQGKHKILYWADELVQQVKEFLNTPNDLSTNSKTDVNQKKINSNLHTHGLKPHPYTCTPYA